MVEVELMDSDRVLFLIWRFLLESNFRESAAKLQKEWNVTQPHRHFPWARFVKSHALVALLQRGLQYQALERDFHASEASQDSAADVSEYKAPMGVFGPLTTEPASVFDEEGDDDEDGEEDFEMMDEPEPEPEAARKRPNDRRRTLPSKRQRLSNGYQNGTVDAATAMDVDGVENGHAYPSPLEGEQAPTPIPRTDGPAVSIQADSIRDLTAESTFLQLSNEDPSEHTALHLPMLMHCSWNPQDPTLLAAAGTEALARIWTVSPTSFDDHVITNVSPSEDLIDSNGADVTEMSWDHKGGHLAYATELDGLAKVTVYDLNSSLMRDWDLPYPPVIKMKWNILDTYILTISPDSQGSLITVFPVGDDSTITPPSFFLDHALSKEPLDASWCGESDFVVCGGSMLKSLQLIDGKIEVSRKFETRDDDDFIHVCYDSKSKLLATGSERGQIDIWHPDGQRKTILAHDGPVTALAWQSSRERDQNVPPTSRLLASAGEDGAIVIWNAMALTDKPEYTLTMGRAVVAIAFTLDGSYVAGASAQGVFIWKVGDVDMPHASWSRTPHPGWDSPKTASAGIEDMHLLCWDSSGKKLAYGVNSRLAVINFVPASIMHKMNI